MATLAKASGVAVANIAKACGVAKASIHSIGGVDMPAAGVIDSYTDSSTPAGWGLYLAGGYERVGQAINLPTGKTITSVKWYLQREGNPTGNIDARLYAATGTVGDTAKPTGSALATSGSLDVSALSTSWAYVEFAFSTPYVASAGDICLDVGGEINGSSSHNIKAGSDYTSPSHPGNTFYRANFGGGSDWYYCNPASSSDMIFYLYGY